LGLLRFAAERFAYSYHRVQHVYNDYILHGLLLCKASQYQICARPFERLSLTIQCSGYTWTGFYAIPGLDYGCYKTFNESIPTTITPTIGQANTSQTLPLFTSGIIAHQPYTVQWDASDSYSMTPSLPLLTHSMLVPTWKPGENIPAGKYDRYGSDSIEPSDGPNWQGLFYFLVIGLPLIGVTALSCCIWCGCRARDNKWKKRMKQQEIELTARFANANTKERGNIQATEGDVQAS
jgi:hypothetical protein